MKMEMQKGYRPEVHTNKKRQFVFSLRRGGDGEDVSLILGSITASAPSRAEKCVHRSYLVRAASLLPHRCTDTANLVLSLDDISSRI